MTLRLLFSAPSFPKVSETFVTGQILGLHQLGHRVDVFTTHPGNVADPQLRQELSSAIGHLLLPPLTPHNPDLDWLAQRRWPNWLTRCAWARLLRVVTDPGFRRSRYPIRKGAALLCNPGYDAIICHFGPAGAMLQQMRDIGLIRAPLVTIFHGYDLTNYLERVPRDYYRNLFERGDLFLPISDRWQDRLAELGCPPEQTRVQRLGTDLDIFTHAVRRPSPDEPVRLMSVARLVPKKGIEYGIRAVGRLAAAGVPVTYDVIGDGPLRRELATLADELGLTDQVTFLGPRAHSEVAALMRDHHILLVPSVTDADGGMEGIPVVIMEAMASGLLVVASRHSGIPEIVRHGETGLLAPERDDTALAACLQAVVPDPDRWASLVHTARDLVHSEYDLQNQNARLAEIIAGLCPRER